ncbi:maltokinase N-terminal cap-like domain-containing protein [Microbacterium proteolyticum]|uniref:maltokinase N-terminal cap-like domain-containing protein n=1 Tax=Microbacterium proteolyticum TaxID=1572644 RepID=UPI001FABC051|nr:phosphotransferase [Microbacterium proteolyticum]MCI9856605.1 aminoglycoside phosphotransferase [Microbacterium proteolyticum]
MGDLLDLLAVWMPRQRWYGTKGRDPRLTIVADWPLDDDVRLLLVRDEAVHPAIVYQVPVAVRAEGSVPPGSLIGASGEGQVWTDATTDAGFTDQLYSWVTAGGEVGAPGDGFIGFALAMSDGKTPAARATAKVLSGEQSNTSLIFRPDEGTAGVPVICKLFRQVNPGINPDVELQSALAAGGAAFVPAAIGEVRGSWMTPEGVPVSGSLAFAQEFFDGVEDAWRVALDAAAAGEDFAERAHALGTSVAGMHVALAAQFPTREPDDADRAAVVGAWDRRLAIALAEVPALAPYADRIRAVYAAAARAPWPSLQRVHGDLHLGQVLHTPSNGWVLLDFEGEPLRPIEERLLPDVAVRDVAGMLRSFDYVSGAVADDDGDAVRAWVIDAQQAFLAGYADTAGAVRTDDDPLLAAFELDKAVYEAIYETRNRPDWIGIPLAAIGRLTPLD